MMLIFTGKYDSFFSLSKKSRHHSRTNGAVYIIYCLLNYTTHKRGMCATIVFAHCFTETSSLSLSHAHLGFRDSFIYFSRVSDDEPGSLLFFWLYYLAGSIYFLIAKPQNRDVIIQTQPKKYDLVVVIVLFNHDFLQDALN